VGLRFLFMEGIIVELWFGMYIKTNVMTASIFAAFSNQTHALSKISGPARSCALPI